MASTTCNIGLLFLFCFIAFVASQPAISTDPSVPTIRQGEGINITCDSGNVAIVPTLTVNDGPSSIPFTTISVQVRIFHFSSASAGDNGNRFRCLANTAQSDEVVLNVLCKLFRVYT
jgi:hypothetical protein